MRASKVYGLTWGCIDFEEGKTLIDILKKHKKYQLENKLKYGEYYSNNLYKFEEANKQYNNANLVCTKENGELVSTDSLKYLSRVVNYELGINFNFHSLRHTHATITILLESGANIQDIQKRLGHSKLATTMDTYSHVTDKMNQYSVNRFEQALNSKIK
ncbi:Phage integrase family protein [Tepidibacter formicigenes DSM 15518]|jgi:integrase|uniref:Phage integrase family protein n=2 Tax=Tepidibacter TaxID=214904 RepID=A0A1M6JNI1_9FIRM|nr:Phage integrase family protein [Tepidibacter formicigenes DSM 15518]